MKKYVCYEGIGHKWDNVEAEIIEDTGTYLKYEGLFRDGVYGISYAKHNNVFETKVEAENFCNNHNN